MVKPKRIQRKRTKGWRMPQGAVYVGRPTEWGNPFAVGDEYEYGNGAGGRFIGFVKDRAEAVDLFARAIARDIDVDVDAYPHDDLIRAELAGKDLACWCKLSDPCHADVLLELANGGTQ